MLDDDELDIQRSEFWKVSVGRMEEFPDAPKEPSGKWLIARRWAFQTWRQIQDNLRGSR